ncbi:MAG: ThuA domain-containing protein, partial [Armatimonadetes bacterium]|nr:ThuA domain-containing protein [Armatimonadota bacterium]
MRVLLFHGENHRFSDCVPVLQEILARPAGAEVVLTENRRAFRDGEAQNFDVFVLGSGFTRVERQPDGTARRVPEFEEEDLEALLAWVAGGKGFVGLHGTAWWIGGRAYDLVGGHANWHPPGLRFIVEPNEAHPVTAGLPSFEVE